MIYWSKFFDCEKKLACEKIENLYGHILLLLICECLLLAVLFIIVIKFEK
jgi:hypothetical protein